MMSLFRSFKILRNLSSLSNSHKSGFALNEERKPVTKHESDDFGQPELGLVGPDNQPTTSNEELNNVVGKSNLVLGPCREDLSTYAPNLTPTFNFAAYVNRSATLQELVKLGVNLYELEKKTDVPEFILRLSFENDIKPYIRFLHNVGVKAEELGPFFTKNPYIFKEKLDDLQTRINYLEYKRFSSEAISRILSRNARWLSFSTREIDTRLGYFQKTFKLTGDEVRFLATKNPRLITYSTFIIKAKTFSFREEMGFSDEELKKLILDKPKLWLMSLKLLLPKFEYIHKEMKISHEQLVASPKILTCRLFRIRERHKFLEALERAQYNKCLPNYVSLDNLIGGTDTEFCENVAKTAVATYNEFLKTL